MSRPFNDTTNLTGLVQKYEEETGVDYGFVSGNTVRLKKFVSATRSAWDRYLYLAFKSNNTWQFDDSNHPDYNIIYTDLVNGQQDYSFTTDEQGNLILDIQAVGILPSATATEYQEMWPIDQQQDRLSDLFTERTSAGVPYLYDKTANGCFLESTPNYNATNGLKVYISREASYFSVSDTTKKPGCPGIHHDYFFLRPAMEETGRRGLSNYKDLVRRVREFEGDEITRVPGIIESYFATRNKDEEKIISAKAISYR